MGRKLSSDTSENPHRIQRREYSSIPLSASGLRYPGSNTIFPFVSASPLRTPVYDIKPYLPYVDAFPDALGGFAGRVKDYRLSVEFPGEWLERVPEEHREALREILSQDPRPSYQDDPRRVYKMSYAGMGICFTVSGEILTVREVSALEKDGGLA